MCVSIREFFVIDKDESLRYWCLHCMIFDCKERRRREVSRRSASGVSSGSRVDVR